MTDSQQQQQQQDAQPIQLKDFQGHYCQISLRNNKTLKGIVYNVDSSNGNLILALPKIKEGKIVGHLKAASIAVMFSGIEKIFKLPGFDKVDVSAKPKDFFEAKAQTVLSPKSSSRLG